MANRSVLNRSSESKSTSGGRRDELPRYLNTSTSTCSIHQRHRHLACARAPPISLHKKVDRPPRGQRPCRPSPATQPGLIRAPCERHATAQRFLVPSPKRTPGPTRDDAVPRPIRSAHAFRGPRKARRDRPAARLRQNPARRRETIRPVDTGSVTRTKRTRSPD